MIVTDKQYQQILDEMFRIAAPHLWTIVNYPFKKGKASEYLTLSTRREILEELRKLPRIELPRKVFLELEW